MGELVAIRYMNNLGILCLDEGRVNHDLRTAHGTIDVKTKERTVVPQPHYDCTAPDYNKEVQLPDWYLFVSLLSDKTRGTGRFKRGWVLGTISREDFYAQAKVWDAGETDGSNGWSASITCRNVPISALRPPKQIL
jgi:hypothetical protein